VEAEAFEVLGLAAAALAFALVFAEPATPRTTLLVKGGVGLAGSAAIVTVPTFDLALLVFLVLGILQAAIGGVRPFALRLRPPVLAVAMAAGGLLLARATGPDVLMRFAAVGLAAGLAASVGLLPYVHVFQTDETVPASPFAWLAFVGPVLAVIFVARTQALLSPDGWSAFGAILIGLGLLNIAWGGVATLLAADVAAAWRYSFLADWGLVLCGFGVTVLDGQRAALLVLFTIALCRLPFYLLWRHALPEHTAAVRPVNLVVAAALAGSAPFAGFAARILLLRATTQVFWPLALALALGMLLWLPGSLRLGRAIGLPRGRRAVGVVLVLVVNAAAGLYPLPLLSVAHL
jgi:NADH:ubiquinone oxidoreductase subunit 2 (subunit N)